MSTPLIKDCCTKSRLGSTRRITRLALYCKRMLRLSWTLIMVYSAMLGSLSPLMFMVTARRLGSVHAGRRPRDSRRSHLFVSMVSFWSEWTVRGTGTWYPYQLRYVLASIWPTKRWISIISWPMGSSMPCSIGKSRLSPSMDSYSANSMSIFRISLLQC